MFGIRDEFYLKRGDVIITKDSESQLIWSSLVKKS